MVTSIRMRSGGLAMARSTASWPSFAVSRSCPSGSSRPVRISRFSGRSSTMRMRVFFMGPSIVAAPRERGKRIIASPHERTARRSPAAAYLASRTRFGIKFGLETMQALLEALGQPAASPSRPCSSPGTNGKGSVAAYVDAALRAARAALRPLHLAAPRARERADHRRRRRRSRPTRSRPRWTRCGARRGGWCAAGTLSAHPTFFEVVTAAAFVHFRDAGGGRRRARGRDGRAPRRDQRERARRLRHRHRRQGPRAVPGRDPRRHRHREGRRAAPGPRHRPRPDGRRRRSIAILREADRIGATCAFAFEGTTAEPSTGGLRVRTPRGRARGGDAARPPPAGQRGGRAAPAGGGGGRGAALRPRARPRTGSPTRAGRGGCSASRAGRRCCWTAPTTSSGARGAGRGAARASRRSCWCSGRWRTRTSPRIGRQLFPLAQAVVVTQAPGRARGDAGGHRRARGAGRPAGAARARHRARAGAGRAAGRPRRPRRGGGEPLPGGRRAAAAGARPRRHQAPGGGEGRTPRPASGARRAASPPDRETPRPPARTHRADRPRARAASPTRRESPGRRDRGRR